MGILYINRRKVNINEPNRITYCRVKKPSHTGQQWYSSRDKKIVYINNNRKVVSKFMKAFLYKPSLCERKTAKLTLLTRAFHRSIDLKIQKE